jgi:hypothetical protein
MAEERVRIVTELPRGGRMEATDDSLTQTGDAVTYR